MNITLRHDSDFGIGAFSGDSRLASVPACFLAENRLFVDDESDEYRIGADVVSQVLNAVLTVKGYRFNYRDLSSAAERLVSPGPGWSDADLSFSATLGVEA